MAMFEGGVGELDIQKFGRWASDTYKQYTRMSRVTLQGLASKMISQPWSCPPVGAASPPLERAHGSILRIPPETQRPEMGVLRRERGFSRACVSNASEVSVVVRL